MKNDIANILREIAKDATVDAHNRIRAAEVLASLENPLRYHVPLDGAETARETIAARVAAAMWANPNITNKSYGHFRGGIVEWITRTSLAQADELIDEWMNWGRPDATIP